MLVFNQPIRFSFSENTPAIRTEDITSVVSSLSIVGNEMRWKETSSDGVLLSKSQVLAVSGGGQGGGGSTSIGPSQTAVFQIPALSSTRLTITTAGVPVFHNIGSLTGAGISGILTASSVGGIARVTAGQSGHVNLVWEDEVSLDSSNTGVGGDGEFVMAITHYDSQGNDLRSWVSDHSISDPISSSITFPFSISTGLTPVNVGDYFTFNFAFKYHLANKYLNFSLPADNPGLDERIEFFFFPRSSVVGGITLEDARDTVAAALTFGQDDSESDLTWDHDDAANKIIGSINMTAFYPRFKAHLTGNNRLPASLIRDLPTGGGGGILASQAEAEAGTENTKTMTPLRTAQAISALQKIIALDNRPTDLSSYELDQVLRIKNPAGWYRVNQYTQHGHAVRLNTGLDQEGANVTNVGVNLVGTGKFGSVSTVEGTDIPTALSPVLRVEFSADLGAPGTADDEYEVQVYIRKSVLSGADLTRSPIYMALYSDAPSAATFNDVFPLAKQGADVTIDGIVCQEYTLTITQARYDTIKAQHDADQEIYAEFYESFTSFSNKGAVFDVLDEKELVHLDDIPPHDHATLEWIGFGTDLNTLGYTPVDRMGNYLRPYLSFGGTGAPEGALQNGLFQVLTNWGPGIAGSYGGYAVQVLKEFSTGRIWRRSINKDPAADDGLTPPTTLEGVDWAQVNSRDLPSLTAFPSALPLPEGDPEATLGLSSNFLFYEKGDSEIKTPEGQASPEELLETNGSVPDRISYLSRIFFDKRASAGDSYVQVRARERDNVETEGEKWLKRQRTIRIEGMLFSLGPIKAGATTIESDGSLHGREEVRRGALKYITPYNPAGFSGGLAGSQSASQGIFTTLLSSYGDDSKVSINLFEGLNADGPTSYLTTGYTPPSRFLLARDIPAVAEVPGTNPNITLRNNYTSGDANTHVYSAGNQSLNSETKVWGSKDASVAHIDLFFMSLPNLQNQYSGSIYVEKRTSTSVKTAGELWLENQESIILNGIEFGLGAHAAGTLTYGSARGIVPLANKGTNTGFMQALRNFQIGNGVISINFRDADGNLAYPAAGHVPGSPERKAGEWHLINGEYIRIGGANIDFNAGLADLTKPLKIPVEEQTSNTEKNQRTINKDNIQQIAQTAESVSALPSNPYVGQKIKPTQAINIVSPAQTLASGKTYIYNGATWDQIVALSDIPRQFRSDADVTGQKIQFSETWFGTQAQLNAYTTKEDGLYITSD